jgi:hypothetical protein
MALHGLLQGQLYIVYVYIYVLKYLHTYIDVSVETLYYKL